MAETIYSKAGADMAIAAAVAATPAVAGAYPVQQVTLTGNLAYTLPPDAPPDQVVGVVFTQDGTGGHTVTYGGDPVTVDAAAGASTLVEIWPGGAVVYPGVAVSAAGAASGVESLNTVPAATGTVVLPGVSAATVSHVILAGGVALMLPTGQPAGAVSLSVVLQQDATGAHAVTWLGNVAWPSGIAPVPATDPHAVTVVGLWTLDGGATWFGALGAANLIPAVAVVPSAPGAPLLSLSAAATSITATWEPAAANGDPVTQYKVWRGTATGSLSLVHTTTGTTFTWEDTGVTVGTLYYYAVSAVNSIGEGPKSTEQSTLAQSSGTLTLFAGDDFNRGNVATNTTGPGVTSFGAVPWSGPAVTVYGIYSNALIYGGSQLGRMWIEAGSADVAVEAKILRQSGGLGVRYLTNGCYRVFVLNGRIGIYRQDITTTSVAAVILSENNTETTFTLGDTLRVEAFGTTIKVLVNGVEQYQFEDALYGAHTKHGVGSATTSATEPTLDDWRLYK